MKTLWKKNVAKKVCSLLFMLYSCLFSVSLAQNDSQLTKQQWLEDLDYVTKILIDKHPNLYYRMSEDDFKLVVAHAEQKIERSTTDEECLTAIRRVVASLQDGHTALGATNLPGYRNIFPVRMYEFTDGIFITGIAEKYAEYVGAKVIKIGQLPAEEALGRASGLAFADNEFSRKNQAPVIAVTCKLAYGLGITDGSDKLPLVVETAQGSRDEILLPVVTPRGFNNMLSGMDIGPAGIDFASALTATGKQLPLYMKHLDGNHNYWFEHDKEHRALYMQFNLIVDQRDESFAEFSKRMFDYIDDHAESIDKLILDLRFNNGGNGLVVLPFMNEIIKRDKINRLGHLYTLIGRRSFSAAVLLVAEMMLHTQTLLVGEPAGAAQNMFSDMTNPGTLPNCGASLFVSSEYFNLAWPGGKNYLIPPHYPAPFSSADFFSGRDSALEAIFSDRAKAVAMVLRDEGPKAALDFFHNINRDWGVHTDELGITPFTYPISAKYNGEFGVNALGLKFMQQNDMQEARAAFELNVKLCPHSSNAWASYGEYFMKIRDDPKAQKCFKKALELNPSNQTAAAMLKRLQDKKSKIETG